MTLQRVEKVTVENWRSWQGERTLDGLQAGLVILNGPNAVGKSGLWEAIVHGLLDRHWGTHTERLRPVGTTRVIPRVEIDFTAGGKRYRIEKHFGGAGQRDKASFFSEKSGEWVLEDQGEEAFRLCREAVLGGAHDSPARGGVENALKDTLLQVLLPGQGSLTAVAPTPDAVSMAVTNQEAAHAATAVGRVFERVKKEADAIWVKQRDHARKNTALKVGADRLEAIDTALVPLVERAEQIDALVQRLSAAEDVLAGLGDTTARMAEAESLRALARTHRQQREQAFVSFEAARKADEAAATRCEARRERVDKMAEAERAVEAATRDAVTAREARARSERDYRTALADRDTQVAKLESYRAWIDYAARDTALADLRTRLDSLRERRARVEENEEIARQTEAERAKLRLPSREESEELERLEEAHRAARARLEAGAWTLRGRVPPGLALTVDGEPVESETIEDENAETTASREVSVSASGGETLTMSAPAEDADAAHEAKRALANALHRFDAKTTQELRERARYAEATLDARLQTVKQRIEDALGGGSRNDLLKEELAAEQDVEAKAQLAAPSVPQPEGAPGTWAAHVTHLEEASNAAQAEVERLTGSRSVAVDEAGRKEEERVAIEGAAGLARVSLDGHRTEHGSEEDLLRTAVEKTAERGQTEAAWRLLDRESAMAEEAKETTAANLSKGVSEAVERRAEVERLETRIAALREEDPERRLAELEDERARLAPDVQRARVHAEALRLLETALAEQKDELTAAVSEPLRERIDAWLGYLLQDTSQVAVSEDGVPTLIRTPAGREVPYVDQSYGTREQVSVLYRLAVADLVAEEAGSGVCLMLDDPFGHTDRGRRARMLEILQAQAERHGHQILIFTCRPEDFEGVGVTHSLR